jgi:hypothetical protein
MCIYYKDRQNLNYTTREHIVPAGLGGIAKLPIGMVSDEFNNDISELEKAFIRDSLPSVARQLEGPGKRGKLGDRHATKSEISVVKSTNTDEKVFALGYVKLGKVFEIPQIFLNDSNKQFQFSLDKAEDAELTATVAMFKDFCLNSSDVKLKTIEDEQLPTDVVLFGVSHNIETNYNCFFAKHPSTKLNADSEFRRKIGEALSVEGHSAYTRQYIPKAKLTIKFNDDHFRIYGKIAFNLLSMIGGKAFVNQPRFDEYRNWIAGGVRINLRTLINSI